jgi:hypothetical protein
MAGCNYYPNKAYPCLFMKKEEEDEPMSFDIMAAGRIIGTVEAIKEVIAALGNTFQVKSMG